MFYQSNFLNLCVIGICASLQLALFYNNPILPLACVGIFCVAFATYSLWFWFSKPAMIATDKFLSDISGLYLLYCLITSVLDSPAPWSFYISVTAPIAILLIFLLRLDRRQRSAE